MLHLVQWWCISQQWCWHTDPVPSLQLLQDCIGVVNFEPYQNHFMLTFAQSRVVNVGIPGLPPMYGHPNWNWWGQEKLWNWNVWTCYWMLFYTMLEVHMSKDIIPDKQFSHNARSIFCISSERISGTGAAIKVQQSAKQSSSSLPLLSATNPKSTVWSTPFSLICSHIMLTCGDEHVQLPLKPFPAVCLYWQPIFCPPF